MPSHTQATTPAVRTSIESKQFEQQVENVDMGFDNEEGFKKGEVQEEKVDHFGTGTSYSPEEKALVRRLDLHILPIIWCMYYMVCSLSFSRDKTDWQNKTDQNAIANARLDGLEEDLGLTGNQFNVAVSILYAGYTSMQIPSNLIMSSKKVRPSIWMASWMLAWAAVSACTGAVQNHTQLYIVRTLLGITEVSLTLFRTWAQLMTRRHFTLERYTSCLCSILEERSLFESVFCTLPISSLPLSVV